MIKTHAPNNKYLKKNLIFFLVNLIIVVALILVCYNLNVHADAGINIDINSGEAGDPTSALDLLFMLAFLALLPTLLLMTTCFTRIIISLSFLRNALGTQQSPPNQVLTGLALFLTLFIMSPVIKEINDVSYKPFKANQITQEEALDNGIKPLKEFMLKQVYEEDLDLFLSLSDSVDQTDMAEFDSQEKLLDLSLTVIVPAFITSELKRAFLIGFLLYIPFLIIDIVVASTLMSMGMVMLPPSMISLPFKLMLFILVDGWTLLIQSLITGFH